MTAQSIEQPEALVAKMELHEKLSMLAGKNFWQTVPIDRLEIPSLKVRTRIQLDVPYSQRC